MLKQAWAEIAADVKKEKSPAPFRRFGTITDVSEATVFEIRREAPSRSVVPTAHSEALAEIYP